MSPPPVLDGTHGLACAVPQGWNELELTQTSGTWKSPTTGDALVIEHRPYPLVVGAETLDDYRHDLRLLAARQSGGLIECDLIDGLGVFGITKRPKETGTGMNYFGHGLVPTYFGQTSIIYVAPEGPVTGFRDSVVATKQGAFDGAKSEWMGDPYGYRFRSSRTSSIARLVGRGRFELPRDLCLRNRSDDRAWDELFPDHPLTRVRGFQRLFEETFRVVQPAAPLGAKGHPRLGYSTALPAGFLPFDEGVLDDGIVHRRISFDGRQSHIALCRHPEFPQCGRSAKAATQMIRQHMDQSGSQLLWGPSVKPATIAGRSGIRAEFDSAAMGRPIATAAFYTPAAEDSLEVSCLAEIDDRERSLRTLHQVVSGLRPLRS